jgi:hypothetical protein
MVVHAYNPRTRETEARGLQAHTRLDYIVRPSPNKTKWRRNKPIKATVIVLSFKDNLL